MKNKRIIYCILTYKKNFIFTSNIAKNKLPDYIKNSKQKEHENG